MDLAQGALIGRLVPPSLPSVRIDLAVMIGRLDANALAPAVRKTRRLSSGLVHVGASPTVPPQLLAISVTVTEQPVRVTPAKAVPFRPG